jgi:cation transport protein ChaC
MHDELVAPRVRLSPELVALCERPEPRQDPEPDFSYFTEEDYLTAAAKLLGEAGGGPLWVFAYGSLLWRPAFDCAKQHLAEAPGWRRDFCMEIRRWRGSPEQPGLMMALRKGGTCAGITMQLRHDDRLAQLVQLLRRETDGEEDLRSLRWIEAHTAEGPVRALACWAEPTASRMFVERSIEEQACMLARACGSGGSGAAYLHQTVVSLTERGLHDDYLNRLDELVAEEIMKLNCVRQSSFSAG